MEELFKQWSAELDAQNAALAEAGEEPLTAAEFIDCRIDDALSARDTRREEHKREWWATYRAALTGHCALNHLSVDAAHHFAAEHAARRSRAHHFATEHADMAHGPLEKKP